MPIKVIFILGILPGMVSVQADESASAAEVAEIKKIEKPCLALAEDKFTFDRQGKYVDYMRPINDIWCWAYPKSEGEDANNQFELLLYEALVKKKDRAIEILLDL